MVMGVLQGQNKKVDVGVWDYLKRRGRSFVSCYFLFVAIALIYLIASEDEELPKVSGVILAAIFGVTGLGWAAGFLAGIDKDE